MVVAIESLTMILRKPRMGHPEKPGCPRILRHGQARKGRTCPNLRHNALCCRSRSTDVLSVSTGGPDHGRDREAEKAASAFALR